MISIIGNLEKPGLRKAVGLLCRQLDSADAEYVVDREIAELLGPVEEGVSPDRARAREECIDKATLLVAFGGDGTILAAARDVGDRSTPILGINLGKLGFLADVAPDEMRESIAEILANRYIVEDRLVIKATTPSAPGRIFHAVNDIVVDKSRSSRVIEVEAHINNEYAVTYRGDGLIVSTPTGSTAYALSNGGPIVTPGSSVFGITPISPHTLSGRPLIVPDTSVITMIVHSAGDEVLLSADGQMEALLKPPIEVTVSKATYPVRLVRRADRTYFDVLRAKLHWGRNPRSR
jgi:NAD+ kinase